MKKASSVKRADSPKKEKARSAKEKPRKKKPKTKRTPSPKQIKFELYRLMGNSLLQAALLAGYSENTAKNARKNIVEKRGTKEALTMAMEFLGVDEIELAKVIREGLYAKKPTVNKQGKIVDWYDDRPTQRQFVETWLDVLGYKSSKKLEHTVDLTADVTEHESIEKRREKLSKLTIEQRKQLAQLEAVMNQNEEDDESDS